MHRYGLIVCWSKEDEAFIADVPELPGCKAHGNSKREALDNLQEAIELWLDPRVLIVGVRVLRAFFVRVLRRTVLVF